ncbi:MAG TPA: 50S ribosomal protein L10 [Nanoarchaeota archaeon]|nr:50S ribosomal protein L10 [Nanoarchaeota archaeon]
MSAAPKAKHKAHVAEGKKKEVKELVRLIKQYPIVGVVDIENLPSAQMEKIKKQLRSMMEIKMSKARLIKIALEEVKGSVNGIDNLVSCIKGMPALIFTKENPFKLCRAIDKCKSSTPIKPGQKAPFDLVIPPGPTPFAPGPIISELASMGIKAGIEGGKVAVKAEKVVAKEGAVVDGKAAALLTKFGIQPMEIGLTLVALLENGIVLKAEVLSIDDRKTKETIMQLAREAMNLAVYAAYPAKDTIKVLITKAFNDSKGLAYSKDIVTSENFKELLAKAEAQGNAVKSKAGL